MELRTLDSPRRRGLKHGGFLFATTIALVILLAITAADEEAIAVIGFMGVVAAILRILYGFVAQFLAGRRRAAAPTARPYEVQANRHDALPAAYVPPAGGRDRRYDTGEIVPPPSVTEHTTRHFDPERQRERES